MKMNDDIILLYNTMSDSLKTMFVDVCKYSGSRHLRYSDDSDNSDNEIENNGAFTGICRKRNSSNIDVELSYYRGKKHGICKEFYDDGSLKSVCNYTNGKRDGYWTRYKYNGSIYTNNHYSLGRVHYYADGIREEFFSCGNKRLKFNYINNKLHGFCSEYNRNGSKKSEYNYKHGEYHGLCIQYDKRGRKYSEYNYVDGKKNGCVKEYYKNNKGLGHAKNYVYRESNWTDDILNGAYKIYRLSGSIAHIYYYSMGIEKCHYISCYKNSKIDTKIIDDCIVKYYKNMYIGRTKSKYNKYFYKNKRTIFY